MLVAVIPALDEEGSIGPVVAGLRARGVDHVLVADNGSRDRTAAAGAQVVPAARPIWSSAAACSAAPNPAR